ncbi:uncharacterized protein [Diadema setosum]|uniref:uncharacterized protein n=1 Tax=Diadema setosum TaxID=31175 RepID=UPI003B3B0F3F
MGSKHSKVESTPTTDSKPGGDHREVPKQGASASRPGATNNDKGKKKRRKTLDPQLYEGFDFTNKTKMEEKLKNSSLDLRNNLSPSLKSLRSNASVSDASWYTDNSSIELIQYEDFEYPFENVVFEGGGNKGLAYAGAVREFERVGIWKNIRRLCGASAGAMWATLLAIGYDSYEIEAFLGLNLRKVFLDAQCGSCSLLPNLLRHFGWHPARALFEWFGDRLEEMLGDADATFRDLYKAKNIELCIVVTNLSLMSAEYCHVKTVPNMPIRTAVRMSLAIPGLFGAVRSRQSGSSDYYVDGGVLCNYPIHAFDGWWLSMDPEDSMLRRLCPLEDIGRLWDKKERFGTKNPKTIGLLLYSSDEPDIMVAKLLKRKVRKSMRPTTKLSKQRMKMKEMRDAAFREHHIVTAAMSSFLQLLRDCDLDRSGTITRQELKDAFAKGGDVFNEDQRRDLFGANYEVDDIFDFLNCDEDDEISFNELMTFAEQNGVAIQTNFQGYSRRDINKVSDFFAALTDTLLVNVKRLFNSDDDIERTIGIDTVYIGTTDFKLEDGDKQFLIQQGERAVRSYLRHYVRLNDPPLKAALRGGSVTESTFLYDEAKQKTDQRRHVAEAQPCSSVPLTESNLRAHEQIETERTSEHDDSRSASEHFAPQVQVTTPRELPPLRVVPPSVRVQHPEESHADVDVADAGRASSPRYGELQQSDGSPSRNASPRSDEGRHLVKVKRGTRLAEAHNSSFDVHEL